VTEGMRSVPIPTGLKISIPDNYCAVITTGRKLLENTTIRVSGGAIILNGSYNDELAIYIDNIGECERDDVSIKHGDVIAQLTFLPYHIAKFIVKGEL